MVFEQVVKRHGEFASNVLMGYVVRTRSRTEMDGFVTGWVFALVERECVDTSVTAGIVDLKLE